MNANAVLLLAKMGGNALQKPRLGYNSYQHVLLILVKNYNIAFAV